MTPSDTGTDSTTPKHSLQGWPSAGHTQGTHGHLSIHFFPPSATFVQTQFCAPHHAARIQGPWSRPLVPHGGLPCTICALNSSTMACHSKSGWFASIQRPEGVGCLTSKTPPDSDSLMSASGGRLVQTFSCRLFQKSVRVCKVCVWRTFCRLFADFFS